jgi:hypothetical protein
MLKVIFYQNCKDIYRKYNIFFENFFKKLSVCVKILYFEI